MLAGSLLFAGIVLASSAAARAQTLMPVDRDWSNEGGWHVYSSAALGNTCLAETRQDGTILLLGQTGDSGRLLFGFGGERTSEFEDKSSQELGLTFDQRSSWTIGLDAVAHEGMIVLIGGFSDGAKLREEIAASSVMIARKGQRRIVSVSLQGTRNAFTALDECVAALELEGEAEPPESTGIQPAAEGAAAPETDVEFIKSDREWPPAGDWRIYFNEEIGACFAQSSRGGGTFLYGVGTTGRFMLGIWNGATDALEPEQSYDVELDFEPGSTWTADLDSHRYGDRTMIIGSFADAGGLPDAIAAASELDVRAGRTTIVDSLSLAGTSAAFKAIKTCLANAASDKATMAEAKKLFDEGVAHYEANRAAAALPLLERALPIYAGARGEKSTEVADTLRFIAGAQYLLGDLQAAEATIRRSLSIHAALAGLNEADPARPPAYMYGGARLELALILKATGRTDEALAEVRLADVGGGFPSRGIYLDTLYEAVPDHKLSVDESLRFMQRVSATVSGSAVQQLAVRTAAGPGRLGELVRHLQDSEDEFGRRVAFYSERLSEPGTYDKMIAELGTLMARTRGLEALIAREFPDYQELARAEPLGLARVQELLLEDEAMIVIDVPGEEGGSSYIWIVTRELAKWRRLPLEVVSFIRNLRRQLDFNARGEETFDTLTSNILFKLLFESRSEIEGNTAKITLGGQNDYISFSHKKHLLFVLNGEISSLPPQVLVYDMAMKQEGSVYVMDKSFEGARWLVKKHAISVLPSVESLELLRRGVGPSQATKPMVAFGDPAFDRECGQKAQAPGAYGDYFENGLANLDALRGRLPCLPATHAEIEAVAASLDGPGNKLYFRDAATEAAVKGASLDDYRIVYFATHGLIAGEVKDFTGSGAEPALVLTLPGAATPEDDGLLTASEVAQLELDADWVVLSACNTATGDRLGQRLGVDALSGLTRAFIYAGARSLLVSHWNVDDESTAALMARTFEAAATHPGRRGAEALQDAMLSMMSDPDHPEWADPIYWAPFILVGEPSPPS